MLSTPIFSRLMRLDRFEQIRGMMRFTDPLNESSGSLHKISFLLNHLNDKFSSNYRLNTLLLMSFYQNGRDDYISGNFQARYGVKIYVCCESNTGYHWRFIIYTGAHTIYMQPNVKLPKPFGDYTGPSKVVLSSMPCTTRDIKWSMTIYILHLNFSEH